MINHQKKLFLLIIFCFSASLSFGAVSDKSINKILDLSGLSSQVAQFPGLIKEGMNQARQQGARIPDADFSAILKSADESILTAEILEGIRSSLKKSINENEAQDLLVWYESDVAKEITRAEEKASTPKAYQQMMNEAQSLYNDTERVEYAKRLDALLGATDMAMNIQEFSGLAVYSAIMSAMHPGAPLDLGPFKAQMAASSAKTRASIEQLIIISLVYSYQNLETEKLIKYENFLNKPNTSKFNKIVIASMNRELENSISKWAQSLALIFKNKGLQS